MKTTNQNNELQISAIPTVDNQNLHPLDIGVAGRYGALVPDNLPADLQADAVLDRFHETVPIKRPEDFSINVTDSTGNALTGNPEHHSLSAGHLAGDIYSL